MSVYRTIGPLVLKKYFCFYNKLQNIYTWKTVREHLLCYGRKLWTNIFLHSKNVLTKLLSKLISVVAKVAST